VLDLESRALDTERIDAARQVGNAKAHAMSMRNQDLAKNDTLIPFEFCYHGRVFLTN
jgi:hypothetical protein